MPSVTRAAPSELPMIHALTTSALNAPRVADAGAVVAQASRPRGGARPLGARGTAHSAVRTPETQGR